MTPILSILLGAGIIAFALIDLRRVSVRIAATPPADVAARELLLAAEEGLALLEERIADLTQLIAAADQRQAALAPNQLVIPQAATTPATSRTAKPAQAMPRQDDSPLPAPRRRSPRGRLASGTSASPMPPAPSPSTPSSLPPENFTPTPAPVRRAGATPAPTRRTDEVCHLADAGLSTAAIAKRLQMSAGEVQLILSLRKLRGAL